MAGMGGARQVGKGQYVVGLERERATAPVQLGIGVGRGVGIARGGPDGRAGAAFDGKPPTFDPANDAGLKAKMARTQGQRLEKPALGRARRQGGDVAQRAQVFVTVFGLAGAFGQNPLGLVPFPGPFLEQPRGPAQDLADRVGLAQVEGSDRDRFAAAEGGRGVGQCLDRSGDTAPHQQGKANADGRQHGRAEDRPQQPAAGIGQQQAGGHGKGDGPPRFRRSAERPGSGDILEGRHLQGALGVRRDPLEKGRTCRLPDEPVGVEGAGGDQPVVVDDDAKPAWWQPFAKQDIAQPFRRKGHGQVVDHMIVAHHRHIQADHGPPREGAAEQIGDDRLAGGEQVVHMFRDAAPGQGLTERPIGVDPLLAVGVGEDDIGPGITGRHLLGLAMEGGKVAGGEIG